MDHERHRLDPAGLANLDLPPTTKQVLAQGLPPRVAISCVMPTVFTSAVAERFAQETPPGSPIDGYVIGSIREQQGQPVDYSWFVIERRTGVLYVTDHLSDEKSTSFVNSSLGQFLASVQALVAVADVARRTADDEQAGSRLSGLLRERLSGRANRWASWSAGGAGVPSVQDPRLADEATDGDDGVGEVEVG
ncbi:SUKH-4 family immunity protein, partial [Micromonospora sp. U21]|nr:SUKH-4 family immunity protein [Micromonospora sp. U21]